MHLHILGICGTFMGGIALLARAAGHRVTGCDANVYPPMSEQLAASGIELINGWDAGQIALDPDVYVIGNVVTRGNPLMEEILCRGFPYLSGPQWLKENILEGRWVLAVAGTHGKTTTASMLAWILEEAGLTPGFLIGGVPENFGVSARLNPPQPPFEKGGSGNPPQPPLGAGGSRDPIQPHFEKVESARSSREKGARSSQEESARSSQDEAASASQSTLENGVKSALPPFSKGGWGGFFVLEADEYDTAYFDKRSKFLHYPARTTILNNLEFDHADIFPDLAAIETQFHHFVRTLPGNGLIVVNGADEALARVLARDCHTPVERFGGAGDWMAGARDAEGFEVLWRNEPQGRVRWRLSGEHNRANALAAIAAARHCGVAPGRAIAALASFEGVKRRMEIRGVERGVTVYDDFAHHPTAIATTLEGLRAAGAVGPPPSGPGRSEASAAGALSASGVASPETGAPAPPSGGPPPSGPGRSEASAAGALSASGVASPETGAPAPPSGGRIIAVLEPRSNTMKAGVMKDRLAASLAGADRVFCYSAGLAWDARAALAPLGAKAAVHDDFDELVAAVARECRPGDRVLVMSNGGFGGIHEKLLALLGTRD